MKQFLNAQEINILDICRDIELAGEEIYSHFAELFRDDAKAAALWRKTAQEERNHADQFNLAIKLRIGMVESVNLDRDWAEKALKFARSVLERVKNSPPDLHSALLIAIDLEEKLSGFHMDCLAGFTNESFRKMFKAMMEADEGHVQALRDACRHHLLSSSSPQQPTCA